MISYFLQIFTSGAARRADCGGGSRSAGGGRRRVSPTCGTACAPRRLATEIKALSRKRFLCKTQPFTFSHCRNTCFSVSRALGAFFSFLFLLAFYVLLLPFFFFLNYKRYTAQEFQTSLQLTSQVSRFSANTGYVHFRNVCN